MKCETCGEEFQGQSWQKICRKCYAKSKAKAETKTSAEEKLQNTDKLIVRQVLYKCASELLEKNTPASKVNQYVKELEAGFYQ